MLIYPLPYPGVQGDVLMFDPVEGFILDVIRFNGDFTMIFYSDNLDGIDSLADTTGPPGQFYPNTVQVTEMGDENFSWSIYQPGPNDPGYDPGFLPVYALLSEGFAPPGAHPGPTLYPFDEYGNGAFGPGFIGPDPGPGGLPAVLIYPLPYAGVQGDVLLFDPTEGFVLDVIRFNGDGTLIFYSDNLDGFDSLADTTGPPGQFYPNAVQVIEMGDENFSLVIYQPGPNDPGYDPAFLPVYALISEGFAQSGTGAPSSGVTQKRVSLVPLGTSP